MKAKHILALVIIVAVGTLTAVIWSHLRHQEPAAILETMPGGVDLALTDLHYTHNEDGQKRWVLDAKSAEYQRQSQLVSLAALHVDFFDAGPFAELNVTAGQGTLDQNTNRIELWEHVEVTSSRGDNLTTERLNYNEQARRLSTEEPLVYQGPGLKVTGVGLDVDIDRGYLVVKKNVRAVFQPAANGSR